MPAAHEITILETIKLIDERFSSTLEALTAGNFVFWVGSGISRDRFPMLDGLIIKVLEFLRSRIDPTNENCDYRIALNKALDLVGLDDSQLNTIDVTQPIDTWQTNKTIISRLSNQYSDFLNIRVGQKDNDFLLFEGINVVDTYGDPAIRPDAEHYCLAALLLEGVITDIASANWDGLIEKAYRELKGDEEGLAVCVAAQHLQDQGAKPKLVKFHGCAIKAKNAPDTFADLIVARSPQITKWGSGEKTKAIKDYLRGLIGQKRTLMLGLSVQDYNIQYLFSEARDSLSWTWQPNAPAYLFSEDQLGAKQDELLENVYREQYNGSGRTEIEDGSVIRAFAKPLLLALLLQVYTEKLKRIAAQAAHVVDDAAKNWIAEGLKAVRDRIAAEGPSDNEARTNFALAILEGVTRVRRLVVSGMPDDGASRYRPIRRGTSEQIDADPEIADAGLPEAAIALSVLGQGMRKGAWHVNRADPASGLRACAWVEKESVGMPIYLAANASAAQRLFADGYLDDETEAVLIHCDDVPERFQRSSGKNPFVRTGAPKLQEVSVKDLLAGGPASDNLFQRFRTETTL